ncbi:MAG TPA: ShlB/FhaC/HecB family hemolysin secretion/activation protein [Casimicrobiaceae bacterium]|nr:ShlB/FhaC/HecB family hemolysin secretion/activation protein [Casimicrobiaceae bacterium]
MGSDLPPNPPVEAPQAAIIAPAKQAAEPIVIDSHGYHYVVTGNLLLPAEAVTSSLEAGDTPKAAVESLNQAYQNAGYFLTALRAEVAFQTVSIRVFHGRITEEDIEPSLVPFYAGMEGREDLQRNTLIRKSALAESYAAREGMKPKVAFAPAEEVGGSKMTVTEEPIEGAKWWNAGLNFGNLGSRYSSRYIAQASGAVRPGAGLELSANFGQGLPGLSADSAGSLYKTGGVGATAITPWGVYGATYYQTDYHIGEKAAPLNPDGTIKVGSISGTQLAYADEAGRIGLTESFTRTSNVVTGFQGLATITDQHYDFVSVGASFSRSLAVLGENASLAGGLTVSQGLSSRSGSLDPALPGVPNPRFTLYQASLSYTQPLPDGYSAGLSWSGQWADATLPQNQQWVLGGYGNLTAWLPAVMVGDIGTLTRASVATPAWELGGLNVAGSVFVEAGTVRTYYTPIGTPVSRGLDDAGISLSGSLKSGTSLLVAYAWPWGSHNVNRSLLDNRAYLYFSLNQSF